MNHSLCNLRRLGARLLAGLTAPALLAVAGAGAVGQQPAPQPHTVIPAVQAPLDLATYRSLALERQPSLAAYRASLAAAQAKVEGLDKLVLAGLVRRDLPTRRKQAELGIGAAQAQLTKAEWDTLYAVTRTYLTVLYARQQLRVADRALGKGLNENSPDYPTSLLYLRELGSKIFKEQSRRDVKQWDVQHVESLYQTTEGRAEEARQGVERALAALREAVGVGPDCPLPLPTGDLPNISPVVDKDLVVSLALERRGEILLSRIGSEVTCLEIDAQNALHGPSAQTFASGSDIHAQPVPQGIADGEYRPAAISIEMPANLVGRRADRVHQAQELHNRAVAVVDKTRNLLTLEAEDAFYHWREAAAKVVAYERAAKTAADAADRLTREFKPEMKPTADKPDIPYLAWLPTYNDLVEARLRATRQRLLANQARYDLLLALAALERITAGGFCPGFEPARAAKP